MSTIIALEAENFKRLQAVEIVPARTGAVLIKGDNENGKTSVLDAIWSALGGGKAVPEVPIRRGQKRARVYLNLGSLTVERTFKGDKSYLTVTDGNGEVQATPQKLLDALWSGVAFDPFEFARMDGKKQIATLKQVAGLEFTELDAKRKDLYETRTEHNRELARAQAQVDAHPLEVGSYPDKPLSASEILAEHTRAQEHNDRVRIMATEMDDRRAEIENIRSSVADLEARLAEKKVELKRSESALADMAKDAIPEPIDLEQIRGKLDVVEEHNKKAAAKAEWIKAKATRDDCQRSVDALTDGIQAIDDQKEQALASAKWPIPDLGFDENGVTIKGLPLSQASGAQTLRLSCAIGFALNPEIKVLLVRDGSLLDDKNLELLAGLATEAGGQVWVERVGKGGAAGIIIEDGQVETVEAT